MINGLAV